MAIQTIKATMQMRYGLEEDLEPDQLTTGEWAVSIDTKYVRMCFRPGLVLRMATYEAFEQDMVEIQTILATCRDIQAAVERFEQLAELHKNDAASSALLSESWAHGETGIREGESEDNSKYWSEQSKSEADRAREEADRAAAIVGFNIDAELSETSTNPVQNKVVTGNFGVIAKELNKKLNKTGDASEVSAIFSQPESRSNIASGEKLSVIFGKIQRFFEDIKAVAFTGKFSDLSDAPQAVNNLASDSETDFLAAIQGKILDAKLAELNDNMSALENKAYLKPDGLCIVVSGVHLNTVTAPRFYFCTGTEGRPVSSDGFMIVMSHSGGARGIQLYFPYTGGMYKRIKTSDSWGNWGLVSSV